MGEAVSFLDFFFELLKEANFHLNSHPASLYPTPTPASVLPSLHIKGRKKQNTRFLSIVVWHVPPEVCVVAVNKWCCHMRPLLVLHNFFSKFTHHSHTSTLDTLLRLTCQQSRAANMEVDSFTGFHERDGECSNLYCLSCGV